MRLSDLDVSVALAAMTLLRRYKQYVPHIVSYGDDAHRLFITSYILASKVIRDKPRKMSFWQNVSGKKYSCGDLVQIESELCMVLNLELQIDKAMYTSRSWLMLLLQMVARLSDIGKNYHVPSSPPPFEPISTVFSLQGGPGI
jgi:hypothetical protein